MAYIRISGRWGLAIASTLLALTVAEAGLRNIPGIFDDDLVGPDPDRGWSLKRGFGGWVKGESTLWVRINSDGLRDREHSLATPPNTVRVAVLGDSYMQGINVPLEKTFTSFLEPNLARCLQRSGKRAEVLNFGVSGYGTAQELLTYRLHAAKYRPDVVLLSFFTNNDVYNNSRRLNDYPEHSPYFVLDGDRLILDNSFRTVLESDAQQPWWRRVRILATEHSRIFRLLHDGWSLVRPPVESGLEETDAPRKFEEFQEKIYQPATIPDIQEAWRVTEALILALNLDVKAQGATLWVVTLSNAIQTDPDPKKRRELQERLGVDSLFYPDLRIRGLAERHGIPVITLAPALADYSAANKVYLNGGYGAETPLGDGHWNEVTNRVAAEMVGAELCSHWER